MLRRLQPTLAVFALLGTAPTLTSQGLPTSRAQAPFGVDAAAQQGSLPLRFVFPQIGNGGGFRTSLVLYNIGADTSVRIEFHDSDGSPLSLGLSGLGTGAAFNLQLSKGEAFSTETSGQGAVRVGYALVFAPPGVDGTAVFTLADPQSGNNLFEAGVPSTSTTRSFSLYVDSRGNRRTGLALVNPRPANQEGTAHATLRLYSTNFQLLAQRSIALGPGEHLAQFVDQTFPEAAGIEGSLTLSTDLGLAAVTLRQNLAPEPGPTLTAFPVIPGQAETGGAQSPLGRVFFFPQVGDGRVGDIVFQTTLILVNTGGATTARVEFFNSDGTPLAIPLGNFGTNSIFNINLPQGGSFSAQTDGVAALRAGYARVTTGSRVGGAAVFTRSTPSGLILYEAGVAAATPLNAFTLVADDLGFRETGLALVSPTQTGVSTQGAGAAIRLYDREFRLLEEVPFTLPPGRHQAEFLDQTFASQRDRLDSELGSVTIETETPLAALTLRQTDRPGVDFPDEIPTLTTFPVILGRADAIANTDLSVLMTGPASPASGGLPVSYSIFVVNAGPDIAQDVTVTDTLPSGTQFVATAGSQWNCLNNGGTVTCRLPQLGSQTAPTLLIDVLAPSQPQTITNTVRVSSSTPDPDPGNNSAATATTIALPATDLSVSVTSNAAPASYGLAVTNGPIDYMVTVTNNGPAAATGVGLATRFTVCTEQGVSVSQCQDLGVPLLEVTGVALLDGGAGRSCTHGLDDVSCNLAAIQPGVSVRAAVTLDFDNTLLGRSILHRATVTANNNDPAPGNNTRTLFIDVIPNDPEVNLSVSTAASPNPAPAGGQLAYTLTIPQTGPGVATNVVLQDVLPNQVGFLQARVLPSAARCVNSPRSCFRSGGVVTCNLGTMCPGNTETVQIVVAVAQGAAGSTLNNQASVTSAAGEVEQTPANNTSNSSVPVSN